jgi:hypothetical protein
MHREIQSLIVFLILGALLIALGHPLAARKVGPNGVYGFRTSITLNSPAIWYDVNERVGKQFRLLGLSIIVAVLALFSVGVNPRGLFATMMIVGSVAIALSNYRLASKLRTAEHEHSGDEH